MVAEAVEAVEVGNLQHPLPLADIDPLIELSPDFTIMCDLLHPVGFM